MSKKTGLSFEDLDLVTLSENAYEFEYLRTDDGDTGIFITVLGKEAPKVQNWVRKALNRRSTQDKLAAKRNKEVERTVEDNEQFGVDAAAIRVVAWRGITGYEYSPENATKLMERNSEIRDQVFEASNNLGNYSKA